MLAGQKTCKEAGKDESQDGKVPVGYLRGLEAHTSRKKLPREENAGLLEVRHPGRASGDERTSSGSPPTLQELFPAGDGVNMQRKPTSKREETGRLSQTENKSLGLHV